MLNFMQFLSNIIHHCNILMSFMVDSWEAMSSMSLMSSMSSMSLSSMSLGSYVIDFRGHAEGNPCSRDSLWLSLLQGSSDFFTCF